MTRSVTDAAIILSTIAGRDPRGSSRKIDSAPPVENVATEVMLLVRARRRTVPFESSAFGLGREVLVLVLDWHCNLPLVHSRVRRTWPRPDSKLT